MKRPLLVAVLLAAFLQSGVAHADVATDWNRAMIGALETSHLPPPPSMRVGAIVQASVFDALNGIEGRYTPIHVQPGAPAGASRAAAVAGAAHEALVGLFPAQKASFDLQLQASLAEIGGNGNDQSVARGLAWGERVADQILAWRATDGFSALLPPYVPAGLPVRWQPTPPLFGPPLFRQFAAMTPWAMSSPGQFLPAPPPALTSARYAADLNEVETLGSATSSVRTAWQTETAVFWQSDTPVVIWDRVTDDLIDQSKLTLTQSVRLLARLNVAMADAVISIWNAKNVYDTWRPITAIQQAGTDGNPDTIADPNWVPLLVTPVFQEYPSGHAGVSRAGAGVLAAAFGDDTAFTLTVAGLPGVERSFTSFSDAVDQVALARIWGGIHFRYACDAAVQIGAQIADLVDSTVAVPVRGPKRQDLLVANQTANTIREFSPSGEDLGYFATTGLNGPTGLAFDKDGNLYVSNINGNTIREFSPTGVDLGNFATTGLSSPRGIAFDRHGNLYVANVSSIREFSPTGEDLGNFATSGLNVARGIALDERGDPFVSNLGDNTVREFSPTGQDLGTFASTGFIAPALIAFDRRGNLYVTNFGGNTIREFSRTGEDLGDFATTGLSNPAGLAFDKDGDLYVSSRGDGTIRKFSRSGADLGYFATTGMVTPVGLAFSPEPQDEKGED
jgi:DNA-binding beta-propeller fold protein YncE